MLGEFSIESITFENIASVSYREYISHMFLVLFYIIILFILPITPPTVFKI